MELEMVQIYENSSLSANYLAPTLILRNAIMNIQICQLFYWMNMISVRFFSLKLTDIESK